MKHSHLALAVVMALGLTACNDDQKNDDISNIEQPGPGGGGNGSDNGNTTPPTSPPDEEIQPPELPDVEEAIPEDEVIPEAQVLYEKDFKTLNALPTDWVVPKHNKGQITVKAGKLVVDGTAHSTEPTLVMLPEALQSQKNYRIDVDFTFAQANNISRWGSIIYRAAQAGATPAYNPYYQFAIRSDAKASNGTEFALRSNNAWSVIEKAAFTEAIDPQKTYTATVVVYENRVRQYLNGVLMHDAEMNASQLAGGVGLSAAGVAMHVSKVKVMQQVEALPELNNAVIAVRDAGSQAVLAPTMIEQLNKDSNTYQSLSSQLYMTIDADLNLLDQQSKVVNTLEHYLKDSRRSTLAVLKLGHVDAIAKIKQLSNQVDISDLTILSSNQNDLHELHKQIPEVRSALDLSAESNLSNSRESLLKVMYRTNQAFSRIVILPEHLLQRDNVEFLQKRLITVWGVSQAKDHAEAAKVIVSGLNGIISPNAEAFNQVLKAFPRHTLLRKPLVVGHRGVPSLKDENTLEGAIEAVKLGADAVENDIYITKDNHLVIMHDVTVDRTTNGQGPIEDMTLAEVQQLRTEPSQYAVPTLAQFFQQFKNNKDVVHFVELKSNNPKIVPQLKKEIEKYQVQDQVVTISFDAAQVKRMKNELPQFSTGFLTSTPNSGNILRDVKQIMGVGQTHASTFNPSYGHLSSQLMEAARHRGITFWPWTYRNEVDFKAYYLMGTSGLTTDYAQYASNYVVSLKNNAAAIEAKVAQTIEFPMQLTQQNGQKRSAKANELLILSKDKSTARSASQISYKSTGTAYVMPGYRYDVGQGQSYVVYAEPVKITVK